MSNWPKVLESKRGVKEENVTRPKSKGVMQFGTADVSRLIYIYWTYVLSTVKLRREMR